MHGSLADIGYQILGILVPALCAMLIEWLRRRLGLEKMKKINQELQTKQELAKLGVRFVEQTYKDLRGKDKYNQAAAWLAARIKDRGMQVTAEEIKGLIEAAIRMAKDEFGEKWGKAITGS